MKNKCCHLRWYVTLLLLLLTTACGLDILGSTKSLKDYHRPTLNLTVKNWSTYPIRLVQDSKSTAGESQCLPLNQKIEEILPPGESASTRFSACGKIQAELLTGRKVGRIHLPESYKDQIQIGDQLQIVAGRSSQEFQAKVKLVDTLNYGNSRTHPWLIPPQRQKGAAWVYQVGDEILVQVDLENFSDLEAIQLGIPLNKPFPNAESTSTSRSILFGPMTVKEGLWQEIPIEQGQVLHCYDHGCLIK